MPHPDQTPRLTLGGFATVYLATLAAATTLTVMLEQRLDVDAERTVLVFLGALFAVAGSGRPWWLFQTVRALRWFSFIRSDAVLRMLLLFLGLAAAACGLFINID